MKTYALENSVEIIGYDWNVPAHPQLGVCQLAVVQVCPRSSPVFMLKL